MSDENKSTYLGCVVHVRLFDFRRDGLEVLSEPRIEIRLDHYGAKELSRWLKENFDE
jgi:hypothetical protein